jgi:hypothetical protein
MPNTSLEIWVSILYSLVSLVLLDPSYGFVPFQSRPHHVLRSSVSTSKAAEANPSMISGRAVIFDIDGTLCDSWNLGACALNSKSPSRQ